MSLAGRWALFALVGHLALVSAGLVGCQEPVQTETAMFEHAEVHYRMGNYDEAIRGYQSFLSKHPVSPLAPIVERRLRNIHREVSAVLGRSSALRPVYHGSRIRQSPPPPDDDDLVGPLPSPSPHPAPNVQPGAALKPPGDLTSPQRPKSQP